MRVLITTDTVGGVWTYTKELTSELLSRGVAVALVSFGPAPSPVQEQWLLQMMARWGSNFHWEACSAPLEWMSDNSSAFRQGAPLLMQVAAEFGAELLHSNQFCFGALPIELPRLVTAHSDVLSWAMACRGRALDASPWLDRYRALAATGLGEADAVAAPTRWMLDAVAANFGIPGERHVIANGRTLVKHTAGSDRNLQAVTAGRLWDEGKDLKLLQNLDACMPIFVAGATAHDGTAAPSMPPTVRMLGALAEPDLLTLFRQSAIYLCTSLYEPFGLAPLEAALSGCAVIANDIPSLREVWGEGAIYFEGARSLSALLAELSENPGKLRAAQLGSASRARRYTAARMASNYLALYQAMLSPSAQMAARSMHVA